MPNRHLPDLDATLGKQKSNIALLKTCLKDGRQSLVERFEQDEPVEQLVRANAHFIDEILKHCWQLTVGDNADAALIAVGGYGRAELHPASDVDVMVLIGTESPDLDSRLEQLIMLLWDIGLEIGHSVRNLEQCVSEAAADITITTNLMESRHIIGQQSLFDTMCSTTGADNIWPSKDFFNAKCTEQLQRHAKFDDSSHNLEPNLKENPGGLRDIQMIGWVAKRHFGAQSMADLLDKGFLTDQEYKALMAGQSLLWRIRFALHLITKRHDDRLLFEYQRQIAEQFGYPNDENNLAVEQFMQGYYQTITELGRLNEMLLQLFKEAILLKNQLDKPVLINKRFQTRNNYLEVTNESLFSHYPLALLEVFLILQQHPEITGVRASTIRLIRAHRHLIDNNFRLDIRSRSLFMEMLRQPTGITREFRRMNRYGILARYLPEFNNIVGRMQFDLFHIYTVDEHILMVLRNLRRFSVPKFIHEFPVCSETFLKIPKPELLYIAGLFHDIAKGRGGNHAELGAIDTLAFCRRHDLSEYDSQLAAWLVKSHLLMSHVAQKMDIDDPDVITEFAKTVGDITHLDNLYLLTVADIRGTNPKRWDSWKASLLNRLYLQTKKRLANGIESTPNLNDLISTKQQETKQLLHTEHYSSEAVNLLWSTLNMEYFLQNTSDQISWHTQLILSKMDKNAVLVEIRHASGQGCNEIFVSTGNTENVFVHSVATLDNLGLNILEARIMTTDDDLTVNSFFVLEADGSLIEEEDRHASIKQILRKNLTDDKNYADYGQRRTPSQLKQFKQEPKIVFDQDKEHQRTLVEIHAIDYPGLLLSIGQAFEEQKVDIHNARIHTIGETANDRFYITDHNSQPITDEKRLAALEQSLIKHLKS